MDPKGLRAWTRGKTGYPLADAGMRALWHTGWMHNRARMVAASFLVKGLLIPWQEGAAWFWDTLVDADLANYTLGWEWCAGCGADAAPYFRIFNPVLQGEKFDPWCEYVRRWIPDLTGCRMSGFISRGRRRAWCWRKRESNWASSILHPSWRMRSRENARWRPWLA
jgi:deoxyribodipyrimidine photolyase